MMTRSEHPIRTYPPTHLDTEDTYRNGRLIATRLVEVWSAGESSEHGKHWYVTAQGERFWTPQPLPGLGEVVKRSLNASQRDQS